MKRTIINVFSILACCIAFFSCSGEEERVVNGAAFEIQSYDDFLWKKDAVDTIKFDLNTTFEECADINSSIKLALCDVNGELVPEDLAVVYVNGKATRGNVIEINPQSCERTSSATIDSKLEIGIVVSKAALSEDCSFYWNLKSLDRDGDIKVLGENEEGQRVDLFDGNIIYGTDICINNDHIANSVKVWSNIIFWALLAILLAWHILSRMVNPSVKFTRLTIDYGEGEIRYDTRGCYKVVLTNKSLKFGLLHRFFVGKVAVICNDFWTSEVTLKKIYGQNLMLITRGDYILPDEAIRREEFAITNEEGKKAVLFTN